MIIFFRGKAATGKTTIARKVGDVNKMQIVSKDSIFDILLDEGYSWEEATEHAYDKLAATIQAYHDDNRDIIVDIGLAHTAYFDEFLSKMDLSMKETKKFLFICSDEEVWEERIQGRVDNPSAPNQIFKSVDQAIKHYDRYTIVPHDDEVIIDSSLAITDIHSQISHVINSCQ